MYLYVYMESQCWFTMKDLLSMSLIAEFTHWGRVTHISVGNLTIIGSDYGLSPDRRQAITWTNVGILLIGPSGTNFSEMLIEIHTFSFKKIHLKMSSGKWRSFCLGLNMLIKNRRWSMTIWILSRATIMMTEAGPHVSGVCGVIMFWHLIQYALYIL